MILFILILESISVNCNETKPSQMICLENDGKCILDIKSNFNCTVFPSTVCTGDRFFNLSFNCRYCFQLPEDQILCEDFVNCRPGIRYGQKRCYPLSPCIGNSIFYRRSQCTKADKSQKKAFLLSVFFGIFGADRFYLDYYFMGAVKLFTLGGCGFIYLYDLFLILFGYLGPSDGSLYYARYEHASL